MDDNIYSSPRQLTRRDLERFVVEAAIRIGQDRRDRDGDGTFVAVLTGFLLGALVASSGFLVGRFFA